MAIQQGIWRINPATSSAIATPERLNTARLDDENQLEELIVRDVSILNADWLLIGRQVRTAFDKRMTWAVASLVLARTCVCTLCSTCSPRSDFALHVHFATVIVCVNHSIGSEHVS